MKYIQLPTIHLKERNNFNRREDYALLHLPCTIISPCLLFSMLVIHDVKEELVIFLISSFFLNISFKRGILYLRTNLTCHGFWILMAMIVTSLNYSQGHVKPVLHYRYKTLLFLSAHPTPALTRGQGQ